MKHTIKSICATLAAAVLFAGGAQAQFSGAKPIVKPTPRFTPVVSIARPVLTVTNGFVTPGTTTPLKVRITGLSGASHAHVYGLTMRGCTFHLDMGVSGQDLFYDYLFARAKPNTHQGALTSDGPSKNVGLTFGNRLDGTPDTPGKPVSADGSVEFIAFGVAGTEMPDGRRAETWLQRHVIVPSGNSLECFPTAIVAWKDKASGEWRTMATDNKIEPLLTAARNGRTKELVSPMSYILQKGSLKTITRTADLPFSPKAGGIGSCKGTSPGPKSYPVGIGRKDGDLTLTIRSGPGGTRCYFTMNHFSVNNGVQLESMKWSVSRTGTACRVGQEAFLPPDLASMFPFGFSLERANNLRMPPHPVSAGTENLGSVGYWGGNPFEGGAGRPSVWTRYFPSMLATLECDPTLINDNAITLRLDQITYRTVGSEPFR